MAMAFRVRVPAWATFFNLLIFPSVIIPDTKTLVFYSQVNKRKEIFNNSKIRNYFIFSLDYCYGFIYFNRPTHLLTLILIVTDCHHS